MIAPYRFCFDDIIQIQLARSRCSCWWKNGQQRQYVNWAGHSWSLGSIRLTLRDGPAGPKKLLAEDASPVERRGESRYRTLQRPAYPCTSRSLIRSGSADLYQEEFQVSERNIENSFFFFVIVQSSLLLSIFCANFPYKNNAAKPPDGVDLII